MIPVASTHRAEVSGDFELAFDCAHCGAHARARVRGIGRGESTGLPWARRPADLAQERAKADLPADARELVELARCPKCRKRSTRGLRGWWMVHVVQVAFVLVVFFGGAAFLSAFPPATSVTSSALAVILFVALYLTMRFVFRLRQVDRSVSFAD